MPNKTFIFLLFLTALICQASYSQIRVKGRVYVKEDNEFLPGVIIQEWNVGNRDTTDMEGYFDFFLKQDSAVVLFHALGLKSEHVIVTKDTTLNVYLGWYNWYSKRLSVGTSYDLANNVFGFSLGNGFDEFPLFHFEDFDDRLLIKLTGNTDFNQDYGYGVKLGWTYLFRFFQVASIETRKFHYVENDFEFTEANLNLTFDPSKNGFPGLLVVMTGFQRLAGESNYGLGLGWQDANYRHGFHYGLMIGYWGDYFTYNVFLQGFLVRDHLAFKLDYERIDTYNLASIGLSYLFLRNAFKKKPMEFPYMR
jgi:hypothetical protein